MHNSAPAECPSSTKKQIVVKVYMVLCVQRGPEMLISVACSHLFSPWTGVEFVFCLLSAWVANFSTVMRNVNVCEDMASHIDVPKLCIVLVVCLGHVISWALSYKRIHLKDQKSPLFVFLTSESWRNNKKAVTTCGIPVSVAKYFSLSSSYIKKSVHLVLVSIDHPPLLSQGNLPKQWPG